jgi:16S rRNA (adenine1518-N6/adenine1519-N6)-dimethyltransferase
MGFLTEELLRAGARVFALEKDRELIPILSEKFKDAIHTGNLVLREGDVLSFSPEEETLLSSGYKLIANIPYYITGAIFEHFLGRKHKPARMVVLIQKEVAERIVVRDGKQSILSLSIAAYGKGKIVTTVGRGSFNPPPTVDSAVLLIEDISGTLFKNTYEESMFFRIVREGFLHKRKLLLSNLKHTFPMLSVEKIFEDILLEKSIRAEKVSLLDWKKLTIRILQELRVREG